MLTAAVVAGFAFASLVSPVQASTSLGPSFTDRLQPGQSISNGQYHLDMQTDGNLVLYSGTEPCWASDTVGVEGAYAQYSGDWQIDSPFMAIESPAGRVRYYRGGYTWTKRIGNVAVNSRGEVWIAYKRAFWC